MKYNVNWGGGTGVFAVPDHAADCLKLASGKAAKVLLYILKNKISEIDFSAVGEAVGISSEDAEDAVSYWQQVGVLYTEGSSPAPVSVDTIQKQPAATEPNSVPVHSPQLEREKASKKFSPKEIADRIDSSDDVRFLFSAAETTLGRILNHTEQSSVLWLHDYYGIAPDILLMIMDLSKQIGRTSMGNIEKIAISWHENNITTHEQAAKEILAIKNYYSLEGQVAAKLLNNRTLTPTEKKYLKEWAKKGFSLELVTYSYEKTVDNIGQVKFSYMDKILSSWQKKGISTVVAAKADSAEWVNSTDNAKKSQKSNDSSSHSYDLNKLIEYAINNPPKLKK